MPSFIAVDQLLSQPMNYSANPRISSKNGHMNDAQTTLHDYVSICSLWCCSNSLTSKIYQKSIFFSF